MNISYTKKINENQPGYGGASNGIKTVTNEFNYIRNKWNQSHQNVKKKSANLSNFGKHDFDCTWLDQKRTIHIYFS